MPSVEWNQEVWNTSYNWEGKGEEWSACWGNSYGQFYCELFPRLANRLPTGTVLEIAPGFGRWTHYLLKYTTRRYIGVDVAQACVDHCRNRFSQCNIAEFYQNDGKSLPMVENQSIELAFSFDSLVHVDISTMSAYIEELMKKLTLRGVAFIHHSNLNDARHLILDNELPHNRDDSVSAAKVREMIKDLGGYTLVQEIFDWGGCRDIDAITVFGREARQTCEENVPFHNNMYMKHSAYSKEVISRYWEKER